MNNQKTPTSFWVISVVGLIWNLLGVMNYLSQAYMSDETLAAMTQAQQEVMNSTPAWATAAFAISVFGGTIGCIGLLMRKTWAKHALLVSFIAILAQMLYSIIMAKAYQAFGPSALVISILVIIIGGFLYYYARKCEENALIG
jgi:uncharacterized membrane protein